MFEKFASSNSNFFNRISVRGVKRIVSQKSMVRA
jgi:hypothetical protein